MSVALAGAQGTRVELGSGFARGGKARREASALTQCTDVPHPWHYCEIIFPGDFNGSHGDTEQIMDGD